MKTQKCKIIKVLIKRKLLLKATCTVLPPGTVNNNSQGLVQLCKNNEVIWLHKKQVPHYLLPRDSHQNATTFVEARLSMISSSSGEGGPHSTAPFNVPNKSHITQYCTGPTEPLQHNRRSSLQAFALGPKRWAVRAEYHVAHGRLKAGQRPPPQHEAWVGRRSAWRVR